MDDATRREIDKVAWQTLRDAGIVEPPVRTETILEHLELYRQFYDLQDPGFIDRAKYKIQIHGRRLIEIVKKIKLTAVLFDDENRIVVDAALPDLKREWPSLHEASHRIFEWHRPYFYGDTAQTLDPDWHEALEEEANYGASVLMFCGPVFAKDAKDTIAGWAAIKALKARYGKSYSTTLRRYVERGPELPMAMLASTPSWKEKPDDQITRCRHFVPSKQFRERFGNLTPDDLLACVDHHAAKRRGGQVADFTCAFEDTNGTRHDFRAESFFNTHYIQTLFTYQRPLNTTRIVL